MFPPPPANSSSEQSGRKQTPAKAEVGRKANNAAEHTAILSFMCSIFLLIFFIGLLPKQACLTRSSVNAVPKLTRCFFLYLNSSVPRMVNKNSFLVVIQSTFFVIFPVEATRSLNHGAGNSPRTCRAGHSRAAPRESISQPARCLFLYGLPDRSPAMTLLILYHNKAQESIHNERLGGYFGQGDRKSRGDFG